jgi:hypothetical protein
MAHLEDSTTRAAAALSNARPDVEHAFDKIENGVAAARQRITELKSDMIGGLEGVRNGLGDLDKTVDDIQEVTEATVPEDYRNRQVHRLWQIEALP